MGPKAYCLLSKQLFVTLGVLILFVDVSYPRSYMIDAFSFVLKDRIRWGSQNDRYYKWVNHCWRSNIVFLISEARWHFHPWLFYLYDFWQFFYFTFNCFVFMILNLHYCVFSIFYSFIQLIILVKIKQHSDMECVPGRLWYIPGGNHANLCRAWCRLDVQLVDIPCLNAA